MRHNLPIGKHKYRGMAGMGIMAALMVVSVVTAIAVKQSWKSELDLTRSGHRWMGMQARAHLQGAERMAIIELNTDLKEGQIDTLGEKWALTLPPFTDEQSQAIIQVELVDAQSKININALGEEFNKDERGNPLPYPRNFTSAHQRFIRLLQVIPIGEEVSAEGSVEVLNDSQAIEIFEAVKDWVDVDSRVSGNGGAEADYYAQLEPPLTIANGPMASITELRHIKGMPPVLYQRLLPYVTALNPEAGLNINTMSREVARSINDPKYLYPIDEQIAGELVNEIAGRDDEGNPTSGGGSGNGNASGEPNDQDIGGLKAPKDLEQVDVVKNRIVDTASGGKPTANQELTKGLVVASEWFELKTTITVGDHILRSSSLINRPGGSTPPQPGVPANPNSVGAKVVRRSDSNF